MKQHVLAFLIVCCTSVLIKAQGNFPSVLLVEHFTNTHCPVCASQNPGFYQTLEQYGGSYIHISYHPPVPYDECIFYQYNPSENNNRFMFYGLGGTPTAVFNGMETYAAGQVDAEDLQPFLGQMSTAELDVSISKQAPYEVDVNVRTSSSYQSGDKLLFVLLAERNVDYGAPNGEEHHPNVFRRFLTSDQGEALNIAADAEESMTFSYDWDDAWDEDELYATAFIQDSETMEIVNAGSSLLNTTATEDAEKGESFTIYPSPAEEKIRMVARVQKGELIIFDVEGHYRFKREIQNSKTEQVDISSLERGAYIALFTTDSGRFYATFLKR